MKVYIIESTHENIVKVFSSNKKAEKYLESLGLKNFDDVWLRNEEDRLELEHWISVWEVE